MSMENLVFLAKDSAGSTLGQLDAFRKLEIVPAYNAIKGWYVEVDADSPQSEMMQEAEYLSAYLDGTCIWSGTVRWMTYRKKDNIMLIEGKDELWLYGRRALPDPAGPPFDTFEYDERTGYTETIIKQYVSYNAGPDARTDRQIPGLTIEASAGNGDYVKSKARFDLLSDLITSLALNSITAVGVRLLDREFQVYAPSDLSDNVRFSDITDTLGDYEVGFGKPLANVIYMGGSGEGISQEIASMYNTSSILDYGRIEEFINEGRSAISEGLNLQAQSEFLKRAGTSSFKFSVVETPRREFYTDFWLGDVISVEARGLLYSARMMELTITVNGDMTVQLVPAFVVGGAYAISTYRPLAPMEQRISRMEQG